MGAVNDVLFPCPQGYKMQLIFSCSNAPLNIFPKLVLHFITKHISSLVALINSFEPQFTQTSSSQRCLQT